MVDEFFCVVGGYVCAVFFERRVAPVVIWAMRQCLFGRDIIEEFWFGVFQVKYVGVLVDE
jgi:hypothetical protein